MLKAEAIRRQDLLEHLAQVHALSQSVASAISGIEKNNLLEFQTQLAAQETICNWFSGKMLASASTGKEELRSQPQDAPLQAEIRQAYIALAQLNRVYAALVRRSRRYVGLIAALYRSHGEGYDRGTSALPQRHTWSCEV